jgi:hypothetical protein
MFVKRVTRRREALGLDARFADKRVNPNKV